MNQSKYGVVCQFVDGSEKSFEMFADHEASEAEFLFFALAHLSNDERRNLKSLGCLKIGSKEEASDMLKPPYHWLIKSQLLNVNQYHFVS